MPATISDLDFLSLYQMYAEEITDASPDYHKFMGLALLGTMLGNRVWFPFGDKRLFPSIWLILLGASTVDHKSTSLGIAERLLQRYSALTGDHSLAYPNEFSHESLLETFSERPTGIFFVDEFSNFLGLLNKQYNEGSKGLFATFYEFDGIYSRKLRNKSYQIKNPTFALAACTTTDWLLDTLRESDIMGGLLVRFLLIHSTRKGKDKSLPPMACKDKRDAMFNWFNVFKGIKGAAYLSDRAIRVHEEWYARMRVRLTKSSLAPFYGRMQAYLLKFALLLEVNATQSLKISDAATREAVNLVEWIIKQLHHIEENELSVGPGERDVIKVVKTLRSFGGSASRSEISRNTKLSKIGLTRALDTLFDRDKITVLPWEEEKGKKKTTIYKLKP